MSVATTAPAPQPVRPASPPRRRIDRWELAPVAFVVANALAFYLIRPGVNDLWAARARASAASNGVGLGYWFGWFGGGSTPGNYSVVTPYACALIGTELVAALSAVAVSGLIVLLVRGTAHPRAAAVVGAVAVVLNLWSGRVPFLLGAVPAVGALIAIRHGRRGATVVLTLLSVLASPVAGAFIALGLSGTFLTTRTKAYRPIIGYAVVTAALALGASAVAFGAPGPQPVSVGLVLLMLLGLVGLWAAGPPDHLRTTLWVTLLAIFALWAIPNGLGSNLSRFEWYCLPVAVVALSSRTARIAVLAVTPLLVGGGVATVTDLANATRPASAVAYYVPLAARLDRIAGLRKYRLEVVDHGVNSGVHTGYDALLGHAMLARGWESQEDHALNQVLENPALDPVTYKVWLDNNAVGYVALPTEHVGDFPEYRLVNSGAAHYLRRVWSDSKWVLYAVADPTPIVEAPAQAIAHDQKSMTIHVPCGCRIAVRVHWSKFLSAVLQQRAPSGRGFVDADPTVLGAVTDDGSGWTVLTTPRPGTYVLRGSLRGLLH